MNEDDITRQLQELAQQQATLKVRCDVLQTVLLAAVAAFGRSSTHGLDQIERIALLGSEVLAASYEASGSSAPLVATYRREVEKILLAARMAVTGKTQ